MMRSCFLRKKWKNSCLCGMILVLNRLANKLRNCAGGNWVEKRERKVKEIAINEKISYIACSENPLSADIGIIQEGDALWLYDVGSDERAISQLTGSYHAVLSHFHQDHTGNLGKLSIAEAFVSPETKRHVRMGTVVDKDISIGGLHS